MSRQSRRFKVPDEVAHLYDFVNTLDLRRFTHHGVQHVQGDELTSPQALGRWMSERGLLTPGARITQPMLETALQLRHGLRDFLACDREGRETNTAVHEALNRAIQPFPLAAIVDRGGTVTLAPARTDALSGLARVVAQLQTASASGALARLKMCPAEECYRLFFDRSKPGSRRWCESTLCGNRMKTRAYRERQHDTE